MRILAANRTLTRRALLPVIFVFVGTIASRAIGQSPAARPDRSNESVSGPSRVLIMQAGDALPARLTVDDAVRLGLQRNAQIAAGIAGSESARAAYRSLAAFPSVQLGVTHAQGTSTAPSLTGANTDTFIDVGETLDTSGQRRFQASGARALWGVARYTLEETRLTLEQQIRDAYWSLAAARAQTTAALEALQDVQKVHGLTLTQEQAGASPRVDVVRSGIDVANAQQAYVTAQGVERTALSTLNVLIARPPTAAVDLADTLAPASGLPEPIPSLPSLQGLQELAAQNRPLLKQARAAVEAAHDTVRQAQAARWPDVTVDYERSLQQTPSGEAVVLGASLPILDLGAVRQSIRAASAAEKQARAQQESTEQQVAQQVAQAHADYAQARALAAGYETDILQPSIRLLEMARIGYQQGGTGILPVIDAETTLRNARTGYINALLALYTARDALYAATGGLTAPPAASGRGTTAGTSAR